jgi:hypothetical protein
MEVSVQEVPLPVETEQDEIYPEEVPELATPETD